MSADIKDGFDLIKYPLDYSFKAMCRTVTDQQVEDTIKNLVAEKVPSERVVGLRTTESRTGKFTAVTVTVTIMDRDELEAIYHAMAESKHILMTL